MLSLRSDARRVSTIAFAPFIVTLLALCTAFSLTGCKVDSENVGGEGATTTTESRGDATVRVRAMGDILIHQEVYADAAVKAEAAGKQGYDFAPMFDPVRRYMENADLTTANMEVPVAGPEFELSGYPMFNAPAEVIDALKGAGVDIVNNATNHTLDRGVEGVKASNANIASYGMPYVGAYTSWEDKKKPRILDVNGMKIGFVAYSYGANGNVLPDGEEYALSLIDHDAMRREISELDKQVDATICIIHAGEEYENYPNDYQKETVAVAREAGADYVQGGHPHVLQPFELYDDGTGTWFSHGNFLSAQYDEVNKVGGIGEYTLTKKADGTVEVSGYRFMPTYTIGEPQTSEFSVVPLVDAAKMGYVDGEQWMRELEDLMNTYTHVDVVDYLD
ncbi:CapA family protein [Corynebacterium aquatimens]|uniref:Poly-gamma-glutamate synthesis protein (Capsule biosynthesis protein) n=1 Tax=Corynebacterium aquatimens TaxID=1190508 RepID=A0A931E361_9CORY|nr:CapA family protein [Corynebacterium aquatimens]MBG6121653.1 poly-gamma-glutamate synthesis protein (capsule biosynthesis protein) [Corynebacterium aquatimens]WJY65808.1 Capsule biosynthesis protein CapA [Corynebacterium aquatimens]